MNTGTVFDSDSMPVLLIETVALPVALTVTGDKVLAVPLPDNAALPFEALPLREMSLTLKSPGSALNVNVIAVVVELTDPLAEIA